jgi:DNA ligase-1
MTSKFRPLLAAPIDDDSQLDLLQYPLIGSPKVDGIRVLIHPEVGPCTRSLKPVHNTYIRELLNNPTFYGLDGEICVGAHHGPGVFARTTSGVMSFDGYPNFTYWVFDDFLEPQLPYTFRHEKALTKVTTPANEPKVLALEWVELHNKTEVLEWEKIYLEWGFEGIMLRHPATHYKFNRSTFHQQILLKMKRFKDDEATIVGFQELERNDNPQERNALGLAERNDRKAGMVKADTLGALLVDHPQWGTFSIGSGFDANLRDEIWCNQDKYRGRRVTYKYQEVGVVDKPRFPIFKGFRPNE